MKEQIRRLVRLQDLLYEIRTLQEERKAAPARIEALESSFQAAIGEIGAARVKHESLTHERQRLHREREELSSRLQQLQQRLMQVSNQREYSAVLNEIDSSKHQLASIEEQSGRIETELGELSAPASEADAKIAEERSKTDSARLEIEELIARGEKRLADLEETKGAIVSQLPRAFFARFESVFRARGGIAVAKLEKDSCGACHVRLRPHLINQVRRGADLVTCDSCSRILYAGEFGDDSSEPHPVNPSAGNDHPAVLPH